MVQRGDSKRNRVSRLCVRFSFLTKLLVWFGNFTESRPRTQFPCRLDVDVVVAAADPHDDAQSFKLLQVFSHESDGVVHEGSHGFIQHLETHTRELSWMVTRVYGESRGSDTGPVIGLFVSVVKRLSAPSTDFTASLFPQNGCFFSSAGLAVCVVRYGCME